MYKFTLHIIVMTYLKLTMTYICDEVLTRWSCCLCYREEKFDFQQVFSALTCGLLLLFWFAIPIKFDDKHDKIIHSINITTCAFTIPSWRTLYTTHFFCTNNSSVCSAVAMTLSSILLSSCDAVLSHSYITVKKYQSS